MSDEMLSDYLENGPDDQAPSPEAARLREALRSPATWEDPAPGTLEEVLGQIRAEREPTPVSPPVARPRVRRRRMFAIAAAVVIFAGGGAAGWVAQQAWIDRGQDVALTGSEIAPGASATAVVRETPSGASISLDVSGLQPAPSGTFYAAWLKSKAGDLVPIGSFHLRGGTDTVRLWAGVNPADYALMTVTLQQVGAGEKSSGRVVLSGPIDLK